MHAGEQSLGPSAKRRVAFRNVWPSRARAVDQQLAQIFIAPLADAEKLRFAAGRRLTWNQPLPCRKIATVVESFRFSDRRDQGRSDHDADTGDCRQSLRIVVLFRESRKFRVEDGDAPIEFTPLRATVGDQQTHPWAQHNRCDRPTSQVIF